MKITTATTIRTDSGSFEISIAPTGEADLIACSMTGMSAQDVQELADLFAEAVKHLPAPVPVQEDLPPFVAREDLPMSWKPRVLTLETGMPLDVIQVVDKNGKFWTRCGFPGAPWMRDLDAQSATTRNLLMRVGPLTEVLT